MKKFKKVFPGFFEIAKKSLNYAKKWHLKNFYKIAGFLLFYQKNNKDPFFAFKNCVLLRCILWKHKAIYLMEVQSYLSYGSIKLSILWKYKAIYLMEA